MECVALVLAFAVVFGVTYTCLVATAWVLTRLERRAYTKSRRRSRAWDLP